MNNETRIDPVGNKHRKTRIFETNHWVTICPNRVKILVWEKHRNQFELFLNEKSISFEKREVPSRKQKQFQISFKNNNFYSFEEVELFFQN